MRKWIYLLGLLIALETFSAALYLRTSGQIGFPLDDAWILQTYARNLGLHGLMAFSPGVPSTGSTSAGWTTLLAAGYHAGAAPRAVRGGNAERPRAARPARGAGRLFTPGRRADAGARAAAG